MSCERFPELCEYVDGELTPEHLAAFERHLFICEACRADYVELRSLRGELRAKPKATVLPRRLELSLAQAAEAFLRENTRPSEREQTPYGARARSWMQMAAAAAIALVTVLGMGIFALRGGSVPPLSSIDHHVAGLSSFGYSAMHTHIGYSDADALTSPVEPRIQLESMLDKRLEFSVSLRTPVLGPPIDARVIELDDEPVAMVDYRFNNVPISMFALSREVALDRLDLDPPEDAEVENACTDFNIHQCFSDAAGTSLCAQTEGDIVKIWVAHIPQVSLEKLTRVRR